MNNTYFTYITATNFEELLTAITTAKHSGLDAKVEKINDSYFLEYVRNTVGVYKILDYVAWRDIKYVAFIEIDLKAISLTDRECYTNCCVPIELKGERIKPSHITDNILIATVNTKHHSNTI